MLRKHKALTSKPSTINGKKEALRRVRRPSTEQ
jgi:hypothetical protein